MQVVVLKRIEFGDYGFDYIHIMLYPVIIMLIPIRTPAAIVVSTAFLLGFTIDMFYDSPGVHISAIVFMAYIRSFVLKLLEPYEGYNVDAIPNISSQGLTWFLSYSAMLLIAFCLFYFSVEAFSFVYFKEIVFRTIFSFISSILVLFIYILLSNPKG